MSWIITKIIASSADLWRCLWSNHCLADHYYLEFIGDGDDGCQTSVLRLATVGLIILLSLPFLLFAFVTTLLNHIELAAVDAQTKMETMPGNVSQQQPVQATS